ncbi:MAG: acetyl-CoA carboxylase carboxyl transferase subunit alpha, partial [Legionellales bacterium]|nr:acetyl-CoA carboxylase carboxyl transferase subunit alpha [Legionellales bacterium]
MNIDYLDFEQPIAELEQKIEELKRISSGQGVSMTKELIQLKEKSKSLTESIFSN